MIRDTVRVFNKHVDRVGDGVTIPLPYGTKVDWLRNVLAAGRATVLVNGETFGVVEPEIVDAVTAAAQPTRRRRREFARFGVKHYVTIKRAPAG